MKSFYAFLKTTVLGGLLVMVPAVIVILIITEAVDMLLAVVQPIADSLPKDWIKTEREARILSFVLLVALCFLVGLMTRTRIGGAGGRWVERTVLRRVPGYDLAKTLTQQFSGGDDENRFAPAVVKLGHDALVLAYIIEEHENGYFTVLLPGSPAGTAGGLQYLPGDRVRRLKVPLGKVFNCITHYGIGSGPLFMPHTPETPSSAGDGNATMGQATSGI